MDCWDMGLLGGVQIDLFRPYGFILHVFVGVCDRRRFVNCESIRGWKN
jgi:hypothetical protein